MNQLTDRGKKFLELIGKGHSSGQIADVLHISTHTVDSHRKNLLLKFDAKKFGGAGAQVLTTRQ